MHLPTKYRVLFFARCRRRPLKPILHVAKAASMEMEALMRSMLGGESVESVVDTLPDALERLLSAAPADRGPLVMKPMSCIGICEAGVVDRLLDTQGERVIAALMEMLKSDDLELSRMGGQMFSMLMTKSEERERWSELLERVDGWETTLVSAVATSPLNMACVQLGLGGGALGMDEGEERRCRAIMGVDRAIETILSPLQNDGHGDELCAAIQSVAEIAKYGFEDRILDVKDLFSMLEAPFERTDRTREGDMLDEDYLITRTQGHTLRLLTILAGSGADSERRWERIISSLPRLSSFASSFQRAAAKLEVDFGLSQGIEAAELILSRTRPHEPHRGGAGGGGRGGGGEGGGRRQQRKRK